MYFGWVEVGEHLLVGGNFYEWVGVGGGISRVCGG